MGVLHLGAPVADDLLIAPGVCSHRSHSRICINDMHHCAPARQSRCDLFDPFQQTAQQAPRNLA